MAAAASVCEYYLTASDGVGDVDWMRIEWDGPDPSFVLLAPLHEALEELGAFAADAEAAWPGSQGTPYFWITDDVVPAVREVFSVTNWADFLTPGRIRDTLGVTDRHAAEMVELAVREAERLTELLRAADDQGCGLFCVVY